MSGPPQTKLQLSDAGKSVIDFEVDCEKAEAVIKNDVIDAFDDGRAGIDEEGGGVTDRCYQVSSKFDVAHSL